MGKPCVRCTWGTLRTRRGCCWNH
uniref:Uncharacterized protein n=1 Tax=Arundo donax TaxID=35708 RepID=A0A0A9BKW2_ARUDO